MSSIMVCAYFLYILAYCTKWVKTYIALYRVVRRLSVCPFNPMAFVTVRVMWKWGLTRINERQYFESGLMDLLLFDNTSRINSALQLDLQCTIVLNRNLKHSRQYCSRNKIQYCDWTVNKMIFIKNWRHDYVTQVDELCNSWLRRYVTYVTLLRCCTPVLVSSSYVDVCTCTNNSFLYYQ